mgnify:CR=1 FL=1
MENLSWLKMMAQGKRSNGLCMNCLLLFALLWCLRLLVNTIAKDRYMPSLNGDEQTLYEAVRLKESSG